MTKPREKTREELQAEIEDGKKKIRQFENREKMLRQKLSKEERRTRSHRLIVRGAVFESIVPEAKNMTDEEAAALLRLALTSEPAREYLKKRAEGACLERGPPGQDASTHRTPSSQCPPANPSPFRPDQKGPYPSASVHKLLSASAIYGDRVVRLRDGTADNDIV